MKREVRSGKQRRDSRGKMLFEREVDWSEQQLMASPVAAFSTNGILPAIMQG